MCMMDVCRYVQYDVSYVELLCVFMYVFMYLCMSVVAYPVQFRYSTCCSCVSIFMAE